MGRSIVALSKGRPQDHVYKEIPYRSGIWKTQANVLEIGADQITGDDVEDREHHGGADRVVCVYPYEHYSWWQHQFGKVLDIPAFGENLTLCGMREDQVCIGDIYRIGDAILQVSQGRYPCGTINKRNDNDLLLKRIIEMGYTGYFFRVLKAGVIRSDSEIERIQAHSCKVAIADIHHLYFHGKPTTASLQDIIKIPELASVWKKKLMLLE